MSMIEVCINTWDGTFPFKVKLELNKMELNEMELDYDWCDVYTL